MSRLFFLYSEGEAKQLENTRKVYCGKPHVLPEMRSPEQAKERRSALKELIKAASISHTTM
jgi:hypothetical protein